MAIGYIQQVPQAAAPAVPPLVANAVLQDHVVRAKGPQDSVHVAGRSLGIDLVNLENKETKLQHTPHHHYCFVCSAMTPLSGARERTETEKPQERSITETIYKCFIQEPHGVVCYDEDAAGYTTLDGAVRLWECLKYRKG